MNGNFFSPPHCQQIETDSGGKHFFASTASPIVCMFLTKTNFYSNINKRREGQLLSSAGRINLSVLSSAPYDASTLLAQRQCSVTTTDRICRENTAGNWVTQGNLVLSTHQGRYAHGRRRRFTTIVTLSGRKAIEMKANLLQPFSGRDVRVSHTHKCTVTDHTILAYECFNERKQELYLPISNVHNAQLKKRNIMIQRGLKAFSTEFQENFQPNLGRISYKNWKEFPKKFGRISYGFAVKFLIQIRQSCQFEFG